MVKAIIFDFNELISVRNHEYQVLQEIFQENDGSFPLSLWNSQGLNPNFNPFVQLEEQTKTKYNHAVLNKIKTQRLFKRITDEKGKTEMVEVINKAIQKGIKIGLVSRFEFKWVAFYLKSLGFMEKIDCLLAADDFKKIHPNVIIYEEAAKRLKLKPEECVVYGRVPANDLTKLNFVTPPSNELTNFI